MSVAIRTATRIQDQDDFGSTPGAGNDGYALTWDNDAGEFVLAAAGVTDHGALTGLTDDHHAGYALLAGRAGGQTLYGGTAENDDITIHGTSNATRTSSYVILQPTAGNVGIGTSSPTSALEIVQATSSRRGLFINYTATGGSSAVRVEQSANSTAGTAGLHFLQSASGSWAAFLEASNAGAIPLHIKAHNSQSAAMMTVGKNTTTGEIFTIAATGYLGIGTTSPATLLHGLLTSSATNSVTSVVTIGHDTSGTAAAGFGAGLLFQLESSTTAAQNAALISALWYEATHATRKADLVLSAYDTAVREGLRIRGNGSEPAVGFYGVTPIARATLATGAGASVDDVITALQNLGLVKQS